MKTKLPVYEYPYNLLAKVYGWSEDIANAKRNANTLSGFYYIMAELDDRYQTIIELYYRDGKTQKEIGETIELSTGRVQQLLSRITRHFLKARSKSIIYYGSTIYVEVKAIERANRAYQRGYVIGYNDYSKNKQHAFINPTLEEMELSVRLYNCLKRDGIDNLTELCAADPKHIVELRNFGSKCLDELIDVLQLYNLDVQKYIDLKEALCNGNC